MKPLASFWINLWEIVATVIFAGFFFLAWILRGIIQIAKPVRA
jgi:hypothetical protein